MRIALYQGAPQPLDVPGNLERLHQQAQLAAARGAELLVCPEMFLTGYNIGSEAVARLAEADDGPSAMAVVEIAQSNRIAIAYGYPELSDDGRVYNAVQLIDAHGSSLCNYRKTHLFGGLDRAMFSPGPDHFPVVELNGWRLGLLICYDIEFPESARRLALAGAELILVPTANMVPYDFVAQVTVRARAYENQCYLAYANYCAAEDEIHYCGQSSIVGPDGSILAMASRDPCLLMADLELQRVHEGRANTPYLHDLRPELYGDPRNRG
ncbi:carbon-nitrogen hydrolase family protein [Pseudomonas sp. P66]|jgi:predicted amidohydrolase|uniref:Carbon-nitrogen hydrolase family protein n=1 Tax=Pseudomonas arcuscaelestis TaxID=2710591 RepID=A0ABS2BV92_9PSED|nr:carbon-nitrogen hydrolase family protein [Pseudomonas arcuscaelestis]MBM3108236.1 carbon-nitrogen hydrolase family protein [Pseudomonas arcuscaelestis]MBM3111967.1 carbon-nitrogen hydrolase family protein [Pseudomonas arcuscaelestis]MBM5457537.1 carbon-nitrogen hydrolase family protein [Pseudomonas arcuscaelestis]